MSKLFVTVASDRLKNDRTAQGREFINARFYYGSKELSKGAVTVNLTPELASVWVNPELRPKDRGIRLEFSGQEDDLYDYLSAVIFVGNESYPLSETIQSTDELTAERAEEFSADFKAYADSLGLHYDRSKLDEWLQEDPR